MSCMQRRIMQKKIVLLFVFFLIVLPLSFSFAADDVLIQQGIAQYKAENYEEALELLLKARETAPSSSLVAYYLGLTYKNLEKHKEAKTQFLAALNLTPPVQDAYTELIETLYILGEQDAARQWLKKAEQSGVKPAHIAFLNGLVLVKEGRYDDAVASFNEAKALDVSLSQPADLQIALAHIKMRRYDDAKKSLRTISVMDPTTDIAAFAQGYERALEKTPGASNRWQLTVGLAYQYDDNVLLKPTQSIPGVAITDEGDSSIVATLGVVTPTLVSGKWSVTGRYNFYDNTHSTLHSHDIFSQSVSIDPAYSLGKGALSFPLSYSHVWLHNQQYLGLLAFRPTLQLMLAPGHIIQASAGYAKQNMFQQVVDPDEARDADIYTVSAGYIHPFNQSRNVFNLMYEFGKMETDGRNWANTGHRVIAGLLLPFFRDDLKLVLSGDFFYQDYDNINTIFGGKRLDRIYTGLANLRWEINKTVSANFQYSHTTADSTISIYDYNRNIVTVGMELQF